MAASNTVASAVVMATVLIGTAVFLVYSRPWRHYTVESVIGRSAGSRPDETTTWLIGFLLLTLFAVGATVVTLEGGNIMPLLLFVGGAVVAFLGAGVYAFGRSHGHPHSHAVGEAVITVGAVGLLAISVNLIL